MDYKELFNKAYELMNEPIIDGNCGELCNFHCCRSNSNDKNRLGMYLLPYEFEAIQDNKDAKYEVHSSKKYEMPIKIKKLYYLFCDGAEGCLRDLRPIQCRTYPFEPHLEDGILYLVIEKNQIHNCPLLINKDLWRKEFIKGIYEGWKLLIEVPKIEHYIKEISKSRLLSDNISEKYSYDDLIILFKV